MDFIRTVWETTFISPEGLLALASVSVFVLLLLILTLRSSLARPFAIRRLPAAECLRAAIARAMETGQEVHIALGTAGVSDVRTADTLAGLEAVGYLARRAALAEIPVHVRAADPTALAASLAVLQQGARSTGYPDLFDPAQAEFVAPTPLAYAAGVAQGIRHEPMAGNAMIGAFGPEVLLPGQAGVQRGLIQVGGTSDPSALPFFFGSVEAPLIGEEIYALGAALDRPDHTGSLAAQDLFRLLLVAGIIVVTILRLVRV